LSALTDDWADGAAGRHTTDLVICSRHSPLIQYAIRISRPIEGRMLSWPDQALPTLLVTNRMSEYEAGNINL